MARRMATSLMECQAEETWSGIYLNATNGIKWLFTEAYAEFLSAGDFEPRSLLLGRTTVFLNISLRTLEDTPAIARVLVGSLLNTVIMADRSFGKVLFLIDEAARLGRLASLETIRDYGRKSGIVLHMLWQSVGQMAEIWGENGARSWIDGASWRGYAVVRAEGAGKDLSDALGTYPVLARSEGDNRGRHKPFGLQFGSTSRGTNTNIHEIKRSLMTAAELGQDVREDEIIIIPASGPPIRASRPIYFRRPEIDAQVAKLPSRFATPVNQMRG
jgi:type IV secretion system protein VirD4